MNILTLNQVNRRQLLALRGFVLLDGGISLDVNGVALVNVVFEIVDGILVEDGDIKPRSVVLGSVDSKGVLSVSSAAASLELVDFGSDSTHQSQFGDIGSRGG